MKIIIKLWEDFKMTPRSMKISFSFLLALILISFVWVVLGCQGPSKQFIIRMQERSDVHFPRYQYLVKKATVEELEIILNKKKGAYKKASKEVIAFLRKSLAQEINAWQFNINTNFKLLGDR